MRVAISNEVRAVVRAQFDLLSTEPVKYHCPGELLIFCFSFPSIVLMCSGSVKDFFYFFCRTTCAVVGVAVN